MRPLGLAAWTAGGADGAVARLLALAKRLEVEARDVPRRTRARVSHPPRVTLLSFEPAMRVRMALRGTLVHAASLLRLSDEAPPKQKLLDLV